MTYPDMPGFMQPNGFNSLGNYGSGMNLYNTNPYVVPGTVTNPAFTPLQGMPGASGTGTDWLSLEGMLGKAGAPGWGGLALGVGQGLFSGYLGLQQLGMAKKAFGENQRQFNLNYDAQRRTTNSALEDRQRARLASNPGAYESVGSYMDRNGVK